MGNLELKIICSFLMITASSCEKFEFQGFFTTYEAVNQRFEQSIAYNSMNGYAELNTSQMDYTIYAMGDAHVGGVEHLDKFFKNAQDKKTTAVVLAGDLTTGHKEDYEVFANHLPLKDSLMYFPVVGNHDLYFDGWKHFYSVFGSSSYFFVVNTPDESDLFICLDTGGGTLGNKQLDWFQELLKANRRSYRYCTVFTHNNLFRLRPTASTNPMAEEIQILADLFIRYDVNMVVTGHDHEQNTNILGNTTHIIMDALQDNNDKASYLKLSFHRENIDYDFIDL